MTAHQQTQRARMVAGELYDPLDQELVDLRNRARDLCRQLNASREEEIEVRRRILEQLLGSGAAVIGARHGRAADR